MSVLLVWFMSLHCAFSSNDNKHHKFQSETMWMPIFQCVDAPGSEVAFYGLTLEDVQSLIVESDAQSILISGWFGDNDAMMKFKYTNTDINILHETLLRGRPISSIDYVKSDWNTEHYEHIKKEEECSTAYIPNVWFSACGNTKGMHIIRNGSNYLCTFKKSKANIVSSTINIYIDTNIGLPAIDNEAEATVFDNLDAMELTVKEMFPHLTLISPDEYVELTSQQSNICLIDARAPGEYEIGHLENAVNIPHGTNSSRVLDMISTECGENLDQFTFVTYCTFSIRAGHMATLLIDELSIDASNVYVIAGSIALWANERRPMLNEEGDTTLVHTYSVEVGIKYILPEYRYCC